MRSYNYLGILHTLLDYRPGLKPTGFSLWANEVINRTWPEEGLRDKLIRDFKHRTNSPFWGLLFGLNAVFAQQLYSASERLRHVVLM